MRSETGQPQGISVRFFVYQYQIRFEVAIAIAVPFAGERMVATIHRKLLIAHERLEHKGQYFIECCAMPSPLFAFIVA